MAADKYTDTEEILELVQSQAGRIVVSETAPTDSNDVNVTYDSIERVRLKRESQITTRLARFYVVPLSLVAETTNKTIRRIATYLAAYDVYLQVHPTLTTIDLPAAVKLWHDDAMAEIEAIVPRGKTAPVDGRDVILDGETLRTGAGDAGTAAVAITRFLPVGGEST